MRRGVDGTGMIALHCKAFGHIEHLRRNISDLDIVGGSVGGMYLQSEPSERPLSMVYIWH